MIVYQYRLWCETEQMHKYVWGIETPTQCPTDPAHTITESKTAIVQIVGDECPTAADGKRIFIPDVFIEGDTMQWAGCGDHTTNGRLAGPSIGMSSESEGDESVEVQYNDRIRIVGGDYSVVAAEIGDYVKLEVIAPKTTATPNGTNEGNCNLVAIPNLGFSAWDSQTAYVANDMVVHNSVNYACIQDHTNQEPPNVAYWLPMYNLIVPAAGDGAYDITLADAILIPSRVKSTDPCTGYYDWDDPDEGKGEITVGTPGEACYNLLDFEKTLALYVKINLLGTYHENLLLPAIKPQAILPHWKTKVTLHNGGHTDLKFVANLIWGRVYTA